MMIRPRDPQRCILRVYYDTVIMSARVKNDLRPTEEMAAVDQIELRHECVISSIFRIDCANRLLGSVRVTSST